MQLSSFTDYGLRVLMRLAGDPSAVLSTPALAAEFDISVHHLAKVVRDLGRGGYVTSKSGRSGGLTLGRPAPSITLGEVVRHLERRFATVECFRADGGKCTLTGRCGLRPQLAIAREAFIAALDRTSLSDVALVPPGGMGHHPYTDPTPDTGDEDAPAHAVE